MKKRFLPVFLAMVGMSLLFSCAKDKAEDIPSPGVIILGEQESDMAALPVAKTRDGSWDIWEIKIPGYSEVPDFVFRFSALDSWGSPNDIHNYQRRMSLSCPDARVQFLRTVAIRKRFACETWSQDSTSHQIFSYTDENGQQPCDGDMIYEGEWSSDLVSTFTAGVRVDGQLDFQHYGNLEITEAIDFAFNDFDGQTLHQNYGIRNFGYPATSETVYLPFRFRYSYNTYKYGYVGLEIEDYGLANVLSCVYEI